MKPKKTVDPEQAQQDIEDIIRDYYNNLSGDELENLLRDLRAAERGEKMPFPVPKISFSKRADDDHQGPR